MKLRLRWVFNSGFSRLLLVFFFLISCGQKQAERLKAGDEALDFSLPNLMGERISLSDFKGKLMLIYFWADWCPHCRAELLKLQKLYEKYAAQNFMLLAVNVGQTSQHVREIAEKYGLTFPALLDEKSEMSKQYGVRGLPAIYVLDESHRIRQVITGFTDEEELERGLISIMNLPE